MSGCAVHERLAPCFWPYECTALISMAIRGIGRNAVLLYSRADTVLCCVSLIDMSLLEGNFMFEREMVGLNMFLTTWQHSVCKHRQLKVS